MAKNFTLMDDLGRLVAVLLRWSGRSLSSVAAEAGVNKATLSRFVRGLPRSSIGTQRLHALLAVLGWGATGPMSSQVHRWYLDEKDDVAWMFKDMLAGRVDVAPLFLGAEPSPDLDHMGLLIGRARGAWLILEQKGSVATLESDLLTLLLDKRQGLANVLPPYAVDDENGYRRIVTLAAGPMEVSRLLAPSLEPAVSLAPSAVRAIQEFLKFATWDQFEQVMHDAVTRVARASMEDVAFVLEEELAQDFVEANGRAATKEARLAMRRVGERSASNIGKRPYKLRWDL